MDSERIYGCLYCKTGCEKSVAAYIKEAFDDIETMVVSVVFRTFFEKRALRV